MFRRKMYREVKEFLDYSSGHACFLVGPHRCGKTDCLRRLELEYKNAQYINLKDQTNYKEDATIYLIDGLTDMPDLATLNPHYKYVFARNRILPEDPSQYKVIRTTFLQFDEYCDRTHAAPSEEAFKGYLSDVWKSCGFRFIDKYFHNCNAENVEDIEKVLTAFLWKIHDVFKLDFMTRNDLYSAYSEVERMDLPQLRGIIDFLLEHDLILLLEKDSTYVSTSAQFLRQHTLLLKHPVFYMYLLKNVEDKYEGLVECYIKGLNPDYRFQSETKESKISLLGKQALGKTVETKHVFDYQYIYNLCKIIG